jgi:hypothetical protein
MWEQAKGTIRTVWRYLGPAVAGGLVWWLGFSGMDYPEGRWFVRACILIAGYAVFLFVYYLGQKPPIDWAAIKAEREVKLQPLIWEEVRDMVVAAGFDPATALLNDAFAVLGGKEKAFVTARDAVRKRLRLEDPAWINILRRLGDP